MYQDSTTDQDKKAEFQLNEDYPTLRKIALHVLYLVE